MTLVNAFMRDKDKDVEILMTMMILKTGRYSRVCWSIS